jgi:iron complex transport system ATP-binding protein
MSAPPLMEVRGLSFGYGTKPVLSNVTFSIACGDTWSIIGRNGTGKSTLIKCMAGLLPAGRECVRINGVDIVHIKPRDRAKLISYVPQAATRGVPAYTVWDFVMLGRFPYQGFMALPSAEDDRIVSDALSLTDVHDLKHRLLTTLSGGELQRVFLAAAVAQQSGILLLDEPATFLDPLHQRLVAKTLSKIHEEFGTTTITITHDVNVAIGLHGNVLALVGGAVFYAGKTSEFRKQCPGILSEIYSVGFEQAQAARSGTLVYIPGEAE